MKKLISTLFLGGALAIGGCGENKETKEKIKSKEVCLYSADLMNNKALYGSYIKKVNGEENYEEVTLGKESDSSKNVGVYYRKGKDCLQKIAEIPFIESFSKSPTKYFLGMEDVSVRFADFNNDSKKDILASGVTRKERDSVEFYVLTNLGNKSFSSPQKVGAVHLPAYGEIVVLTEEVNNDKLEDIGCRTFSNDNPSYSIIYDLINKGNGFFETKITHKGFLK